MQRLLIVCALFAPGCVAWQSSLDEVSAVVKDLRLDVEQFRVDSSLAMAQYEQEVSTTLTQYKAQQLQMVTQVEEEFQAKLVEVQSKRASGEITEAQANTLISNAATVAREEARQILAAADAQRAQAAKDAESARKIAEAEAKAVAVEKARMAEREAEQIARENEAKTQQMLAELAATAAQTFLGSPAAGALIRELAAKSAAESTEESLEEFLSDPEFANKVTTIAADYEAKTGEDFPIPPEYQSLLLLLLGVGGYARRSMTRKALEAALPTTKA